MKVIFTEGHIDAIRSMLAKQEAEQLEQFATMIGKFDSNDSLVVESFELWDNSKLIQTETTVQSNSDAMWDTIAFNMESQKCDFIITLHTHPEYYGTNPNDVIDESDTQAFKHWTQNFDDFGGRICLNGIVTKRDGLLLTYYNKATERFLDVDYEMVPSKKESSNFSKK